MKDKSKTTVDLARFRTIVECYGADSSRWPEQEREEALALAESSSEAAAMLREAAGLDSLLKELPTPEPSADLLRAVAEIPLRHDPAAIPDLSSGWRLYWPFGAPWKPALAAALAGVLGMVTGVASVDLYAEEPVVEAVYAEEAYAGVEEVAGWEDLTGLVFASDTEGDLSSLALASEPEQEQEP
jgi:hypothetical protein